MDYKVVGTFTDVKTLRGIEPDLSLGEVEFILQGRDFVRWYTNNKRVINLIAAAVPLFTLTMFGLDTHTFLGLASPAAPAYITDVTLAAAAKAGGYSFWAGNGAILLHMLIIGFVTLIVTTFLKFTGRGDIAPLAMFVGGGVILYEVLGLFKSIYVGIATFFQM